jgi:hypothetical protein
VSTRKRFYLDVIILVAFIAAYKPLTTGLGLHEWLSLLLIGPAIFHLIINWDWVLKVAASFARRLRTTTRLNLAVDTVLFLSTVTVMLSGFLVSRTLAGVVGLATAPDPLWHTVHSLSADATFALVVVHTLLHWRWFARVMGVAPSRRTRPLPQPVFAPVPPATVPIRSMSTHRAGDSR